MSDARPSAAEQPQESEATPLPMDGPIRVAFCMTTLHPGGAERAFLQVVRHADPNRFTFRVDGLSGDGPLADAFRACGADVHGWSGTGLGSLSILPRLRREWNAWRPHVVQGVLFRGNLASRLARPRRISADLPVRPLVLSAVRVADRRGSLRFRIDRLTKQRVDHHVMVSRGVGEFYAERVGLRDDEWTVIPNGVDAEAFSSATPLSHAELDLPAGAVPLLAVGRLDEQKGFDVLIDAFDQIADHFPQTMLLIVGEGAEREQLTARIRQTGRADRIRLLGRRDDLPRLYRAASLFILSSRWEGMPNVLLEAVASGTPVVCTDVEGVRELLPEHAHADLAEPGNAASLADCLSEALSKPQMMQEFAEEAQHLVVRNSTWPQISQLYQILWHERLRKRLDSGAW